MFYVALFLHIVGVVLLFIAIGVELIAYVSRRRADSVEQVRAISSVTRYNPAIHSVAIILILGGGIYMAASASLFGQTWVVFALVVTVLFAIVGIVIDAPRSAAVAKLCESNQSVVISPELAKIISDPIWGSWIVTGCTIALWLIYVMTNKPDTLGCVVSLVIAFVLAAVSALLLNRTTSASVDVSLPEEAAL